MLLDDMLSECCEAPYESYNGIAFCSICHKQCELFDPSALEIDVNEDIKLKDVPPGQK